MSVARDRLQIWAALEESVKLQSHYAALLNQYDGGNRRGFANAEAWCERHDEGENYFFEQAIALLADLVDRWSDERGYDGAIQRARAFVREYHLRWPTRECLLQLIGDDGMKGPTIKGK